MAGESHSRNLFAHREEKFAPANSWLKAERASSNLTGSARRREVADVKLMRETVGRSSGQGLGAFATRKPRCDD